MVQPVELSIIVPVYNAGPSLRTCVESVLAQAYACWELILVDDGSTDESLALMRDWEATDRRIQVVSIANSGPGVARNVGLDRAKGEFVMFLDADDRLMSNSCGIAVAAIGKSRCEFVCFGAKFSSGEKSTIGGFRYDRRSFSGREMLISLLSGGEIKSVVWNKIYRRSLLDTHGIRFPPNRVNEDSLFVMTVALRASAAELIPDVLYHHSSSNPLSFSNNITAEHFASSLDVLGAEWKLLEDSGIISEVDVHFSVHAAKLLSYLVVLAAFGAANFRQFRSCVSAASESEWLRPAADGRRRALPLMIRLRLLACRYPRTLWLIVSSLRRMGIALQ